MKKYLLFTFLFLTASLIIISCEKTDQRDEGPKKIVLNKKSAEIIEADQAFAFELFNEVLCNSEEANIMISPLSVSYALGMTYNGSAGSTMDAFADVLHFNDLTAQEVNESYKDLMNQLIHLDNKVQFSIANSIWYRLGFEVIREFIVTNQTYFDAVVREMDFSDPNAVNIINKWIEDKTNGKIRDMLDYIPSDAVMYLINAIYFNAKWKYRFNPADTHTGTFYHEEGGTQQADFMKVNGTFRYKSDKDYSAVELPYGDSTFSMVVIMPASGKKVDDLAGQLNITTWKNWYGSFLPANIQVELPKFKYDFKDLLNDPLTNLGLGIAFDLYEADFTRIRERGGICISRVIHQTFIDVKEEGTEAAAATIVELRENSGPQQPVIFRAEKPFLYLIKENSTGAILFMGKVGKPKYE